MSTTLKFKSFVNSNIRETTGLTAVAPAGSSTLEVRSTQGFTAGDVIYLGELGREGCERSVVGAVSGPDAITLVSATELPHSAFSAVTAVHGDRIRIYRAVNVMDTPPDLASFSVLATRSIDPDQPDTYYTDSAGSSGYWYRYTYFNETSLDETELDEFYPVRGDDFAHYASLEAIRQKAGFDGAARLSDVTIDQQRRIAESAINARLGGFMTVPFKRPVPDIINSITILLAAGYLKNDAYRNETAGKTLIAEAEAGLQSLVDGSAETGNPEYDVASGVSGSFGDDEDGRLFHIGDEY